MSNAIRHDEIEAVIAELRSLWRLYPEQRLGQLVANLTRDELGATDIGQTWNASDRLLKQRMIVARQTVLGLARAHLHMEMPDDHRG